MHPRDVKYTHDCTQSHSNRVSLKENLRETIEIWWAFPVDIFPLEPMHFVFTTRKGLPIWSMYGICTNIWGIFMVNVTIYSIHGSYGLWIPFFGGKSFGYTDRVPEAVRQPIGCPRTFLALCPRISEENTLQFTDRTIVFHRFSQSLSVVERLGNPMAYRVATPTYKLVCSPI